MAHRRTLPKSQKIGKPKSSSARRLLEPERLERREVLTVPFGAIANDTAEYMLGDVYVSVVFMESDGTIDTNRENWTPEITNNVKQKIEEGLNWWKDTLNRTFPNNKAPLHFTIDYTYADNPVLTGYEPISRPSDDFSRWIDDFFDQSGFNQSSDFSLNSKAFNHSQRAAHDADWAFTIFVVNDTNDPDHQFNPSGTFDRSFAYAGGRFEVVLATRPASTFSHETGHMFWALDEYFGGATWTTRRGYYNTQNTNGADNSTPGFHPANSIMSSGDFLTNAFNTNTSPATTLEMIGWKDSDNDGIFDVLDVPFSLSGVGSFDPSSRKYRFHGTSAVRTSPNLNSDATSLKNDITINQINRAEYQIDDGDWTLASTYNDYIVSLDLLFDVPEGDHTVRIRTVDTRTGVSSEVFEGSTARAEMVPLQGINGFVWKDTDGDGQRDVDERGVPDRAVRLVDESGNPLSLLRVLEPDDHPSGTNVGTILSGVTLSTVGSNAFSSAVTSRTSAIASTGSRVFSNNNSQDSWTVNRQLKIAFANPVTSVGIDAIGNGPGVDYGRLDAYDSNDRILGRYTTQQLSSGELASMSVTDGNGAIAYVLAYGHATSGVLLDNLRIGPRTVATTDAEGSYSISPLPAGTYTVEVMEAPGWANTTVESATVVVGVGAVVKNLEFGQVTVSAPWQNPDNQLDVNDDTVVAPIDVLVIINEINARGSRPLAAPENETSPPPYLDVNGDNFLSAIDALAVINSINGSGNGEGNERPARGPTDNFTKPTRSSLIATEPNSGAAAGEGRDAASTRATDAVFGSMPAEAFLPLSSAKRRLLESIGPTIQ